MNHQKTNLGKIQAGTENSNEFLKALMNDPYPKFAVNVHSVSDIDFVINTPFATYKIPRSYFMIFEKASENELQNVIGHFTYTDTVA